MEGQPQIFIDGLDAALLTVCVYCAALQRSLNVVELANEQELLRSCTLASRNANVHQLKPEVDEACRAWAHRLVDLNSAACAVTWDDKLRTKEDYLLWQEVRNCALERSFQHPAALPPAAAHKFLCAQLLCRPAHWDQLCSAPTYCCAHTPPCFEMPSLASDQMAG